MGWNRLASWNSQSAEPRERARPHRQGKGQRAQQSMMGTAAEHRGYNSMGSAEHHGHNSALLSFLENTNRYLRCLLKKNSSLKGNSPPSTRVAILFFHYTLFYVIQVTHIYFTLVLKNVNNTEKG